MMASLHHIAAARLVLLLSVSASLLAQASPSSRRAAQQYFERGTAAYQAQDWPTAIRELTAASLLAKRPEYLFALGQAYRRSGDCASAIPQYQAFLLSAAVRQRHPVEELIGGCEVELERARRERAAAEEHHALEVLREQEGREQAARKPQSVKAEPVTGDPVTRTQVAREPATNLSTVDRPLETLPTTRGARATSWFQDPLGGALMLAAATALGVGAGFLVMGGTHLGRAASLESYGEYLAASLAARAQQTIGLSALGAGLLLGAGATWRFLAFASGPPSLSVAPCPRGWLFTMSGSF